MQNIRPDAFILYEGHTVCRDCITKEGEQQGNDEGYPIPVYADDQSIDQTILCDGCGKVVVNREQPVPSTLDLYNALKDKVKDVVYESNTGGGCTMVALYLPHYHVIYADNIGWPEVSWHAVFDVDFEYDNPIEMDCWLDAYDDRPGWRCAPTLDDLVTKFTEYADKARKAEVRYGRLSDDAVAVHEHLVATEVDGPLAFFTMISDRMVEEDGIGWAGDPQRLAPALDELIDAGLLSHEGVIDPLGGTYLLTLLGGNATEITGDDPRFRH